MNNLLKSIYKVQTAGRINLIGEHTDHQQGLVLPIAINAKISIYGSEREDTKIIIYSENFKQKIILNVDEIDSYVPEKDHWVTYVVGILKSFHDQFTITSGCNIAITSDLPQGIGLSSSAALEIGVYSLLENIYHHNVEPLDVVKSCWSVENSYVGVRCGIMDQFIVRFGEANSALTLNCADLSYEKNSLPPDVSLLIVDTLIRHTLIDSPYNTRITECSVALHKIQEQGLKITSLSELQLKDFDQIKDKLNKPFSSRVQHVLTENNRVREFSSLLHTIDNGNSSEVLKKLGSLLYESHTSLKNNFEASWNRADQIVDYARTLKSKGVYGARMMGGGFGGSILLMVDSNEQEQIIENLQNWFTSTFKEKTTIFQFTSSNGTEIQSITKDEVPYTISYLFN